MYYYYKETKNSDFIFGRNYMKQNHMIYEIKITLFIGCLNTVINLRYLQECSVCFETNVFRD